MAPRPRKKDKWLPERVYKGKSAYEYHPRGGGAIRLCSLDTPRLEVLIEYQKHIKQFQGDTTASLVNDYFKSKDFAYLKPRTQKDRKDYWKVLLPVFGHVAPNSIKPHHIRRYMDIRGEKSEAMANKEIKFFRVALGYGFERGMLAKNPCDGIRYFREKPRDRYITDEEYQNFYKCACDSLRIFMEISYTCAARGQDVRKILINDITSEGLLIIQAKTGKKQIKLWSNRLRAAVERARKLRQERNPLCTHLMVNTRGKPFGEWELKALWKKARKEYGKCDFTYHDIKAKAVSDFNGDKMEFSGHKSRSMMERYNRTPDKVETIDWGK